MKKVIYLFCVVFLFWSCTEEKFDLFGGWRDVKALQANKISYYMVFFRDKVGTPYQISEPCEFLSARSISRRRKHNVVVKEEDLPVVPKYVEGLQEVGAQVHYSTRWLNATLVQGSEDVVNEIKQLSYVRDVALVAPGSNTLSTQKNRKFLKETQIEPLSDKMSRTNALRNAVQNEMLGVDNMHKQSIYGKGVLIALLDGGFPNIDNYVLFQHIHEEKRMLDAYSFVRHRKNVYDTQNGSHGTLVLSVMAAYQDDVYEGIAYKAQYALYETEEGASEYRIEEYNWLFAAERADSLGADIIQSSLGYSHFDIDTMSYTLDQFDGQQAVSTRAAEMASERGILVIVAAGNGGPSNRSIGAPADGANVIAVGGVNGSQVVASFSSRGPTADGRIKPDISAMGESTVVTIGVGTDVQYWEADGTSFASPLISAFACWSYASIT